MQLQVAEDTLAPSSMHTDSQYSEVYRRMLIIVYLSAYKFTVVLQNINSWWLFLNALELLSTGNCNVILGPLSVGSNLPSIENADTPVEIGLPSSVRPLVEGMYLIFSRVLPRFFLCCLMK